MPASGVGWTDRARVVLIAILFLALPITETAAEDDPPPTDVANALEVKAAAESAFKQDILGNFVRTVENQVLSLAGSEFTRRYADGYDEANRPHVTALFHAVAVANADYMQVRFLDLNGRERVRIDRPKDQTRPGIVPDGEMQDKSAKSYFQGPKSIPEGGTWHSKVNLNMERGEIEKPIRPTFRLSTPVYASGSFRGVVVINLDMDRILKLLGHSADFDVYIIDREGEFILHPDPDKAWSRYLPGRGRFDDEFRGGPAGGVAPYAFSLKAVFQNQDQARLVLVPNAYLLASLGVAGDSETHVTLTEEEERWIAEHPNVRVHNESDWPPFNFAENGTPKGYSVDFMNLLGKKTGLKIEYVTGPSWNQFLEMMKSGDLDVMLNIVKTPERQKYLLYTDPYFENPNTILTHRNKPYGSLEELSGKTVSVPKGFFYEEILKRDYPGINLHLVKNSLEAMKAVSYGKADAALGELAVFNHLIERHMMTDLAISGEVKTENPELVLLNIAVRKDLPVLLSILKKAMTAVSVEEERVLRNRWMPKTDRPDYVDLTRQQRRWLEEHPKLTLGIDSAWPPFEFLDNGAYSGIGAGYVELVSRRLGVEMEPFHDLSWSEVMDKSQAGEIDILPTVMRTDEREKFLAFTKPYVSFPMVIATRKDAPFVNDITGLAGLKVGVVRDYVTHELLERNHGDLDIVPFPTLADGLQALEDGQVVAFVDNLAAISYETQRAGLESTRIAAPTEYQFELAMAVRKDLSELVPILNLALDTITDQERAAIRNAWINVQVSFGTDIKTILTWAFPVGTGVIVVFVAIVLWNRGLKREVTERKKAEQALATKEAQLRIAMENMPGGMLLIDGELNISIINEYFKEISSLPADREWIGEPVVNMRRFRGERGDYGDIDLSNLEEDAQELYGSGIALAYERQNPDGRWIDMKSNPTPQGGSVLVVTDITERKAAEEALTLSEERTRLLLESVGEGVFGVNLAGAVTFINPTALTMLGHEREDMIGTDVHSLVHHSHADGSVYPLEECPMWRAYTTGESTSVDDEMLWRKDGAGFPARYSSTPIVRDDEIVGAVISFMDITERKLAERALAESEERTRLLLESVGEGVFGVDLEGGITFINPPALAMLGFGHEELIGYKAHPIFHHSRADGSDYPVTECPMWRAFTYGESSRIDDEVLWHKDGTCFPVEYNATPILRDDEMVGAVISFADITERKRAAMALADSEERTRLLLESVGEGVFGVDLDGIVTFVNPAALTMLGYERDDMTGKDAHSLIHHTRSDGGRYPIEECPMWRAYIIGESTSADDEMLWRKDGSGFSARYYSTPIVRENDIVGAVISFMDITERKLAEKALADSEERSRLLLESVGEGVFGVDLQGRITFVNPPVLDMLGFKSEEMIGTGAHALFHYFRADGSDYPVTDCWMYKSFTEGESYRIDDEVLWCKDGTPLSVEYNSTPILRENELVGAVISFNDISERLKAQHERDEALEVVSSSIRYASRIQQSVLPHENTLSAAFADHFVFWQPRDVVGGDIYWCHDWGSGVLILLGDCTGHGVPGAFMTLIANGALDSAYLEVPPGDAATLLKRMHQLIQLALGQDLSKGDSDDGLEVGACFLQTGRPTLTFAGARFSLFVSDAGEVREIKGEKTGLGYRGIPRDVSFTNQTVDFSADATYYMTSDGLIDQIGGERKRSFGKRRFKELLASIRDLPMSRQRDRIRDALSDWQGNQRRRDDVSVIGFKPR